MYVHSKIRNQMPSRGVQAHSCAHIALVILPFVVMFVVINLLLLSTLSTLSDSLRLNARCWAVSVSRLSIVVRIPLPWIRLPFLSFIIAFGKALRVPPVRRFALPLYHRGHRHRFTSRATSLPPTNLGSLL